MPPAKVPTVLVEDAVLVTQDAERRVLRGNLLTDERGRIAAVGPDARGPADEILDGSGHVLVPGFVNAHTHLAMTLFRGFADDLPLESWLRDRIWPAEARLDARAVRAGSELGLLEMIAGGTTCFNDMYFFAQETADAAAAAGVRAVVGHTFLDFPTPELKPEEMAAAARRHFARWQGHPLVAPSLAPHSAYVCGPATLDRIAGLARELGDPLVHVHCAETRTETYDVLERHGVRPLGALARHGLLGRRTVLAHCGWITKEETREIAAAGASIAHCPVSNAKLATGGYLPLPEALAAGVPVGLGTDGVGSNNTLDVVESMKFAALLHKHHRWDAAVVPAQAALDAATRGGARALGLEREIGSLEVGKSADFALLDFRKPRLTPVHDVVSHLVYAARGDDVAATVVGGRVLYAGGRFRTMDADRVLARAQAEAQRVCRAS